ncbi:methyltransferase domain-containing protein [Hymenobacter busanensis]|uniref:Methyltransferase domain-containing protein n=1 Tax=Hymenobacter busanensis TaxID=2607656 RepID=A0A7L4ZX16_9BACT|nr:methyltransferase domain-containing protein [Hymenobacter busanensis]KAA9333279.1 methyltransferase domain-containing protein [Hymenobacter busanensis]QHJ08044.1 methyltransferase domain-containing protein [Hymenobacter busanensis]
MPDLAHRSSKPELMDDLTLATDALRQNLDELEIINTRLGGYAPVLDALQRLRPAFAAESVLRVADIGCGGGDMLRRMAQWARRRGQKLELIGIDANAFMLEYAAAKSVSYPEISYQQADVFAPAFQAQRFDIVSASLFCHHFSDEELVALLQGWGRQATGYVIINDLHRHWLAYHSIKWLTRLLGGSHLVRHDAPLSVARAFTRADWERLLARAGIEHYRLRWRWAFRWQLVYSATPEFSVEKA